MAVVAQVAGLARELARSAGVAWSQVAAMAVGLPGIVHLDGSGLRLAPNLPPLADLDVVAALGEQVGVPVTLDNDLNMATVAEQRHGRGAGVSDFVFIGVGTGVGMGIVASGRALPHPALAVEVVAVERQGASRRVAVCTVGGWGSFRRA